MRYLLFLLSLLMGCGDEAPRRCLERAECFAGEYCRRGVCSPYSGTVETEEAPDHGIHGEHQSDMGTQ